MLTTSIVDTVCGSLADAITGESGSAQRLVELERANVFITPLDDRREWYRYHHLLVELLRIELDRRHPDQVALLHQRAATWYAEHALPDRAVRHAIAAGDMDLAAQVDQRELPALHRVGPDGDAGRLARGSAGRGDRDRPPARRRQGLDDALPRPARRRQGGARRRDPGAGGDRTDAGRGQLDRRDGGAHRRGLPGRRRRRGCSAPPGARSSSRPTANRRGAITVHVLLGFALVRAGRFEEAREPLRIGSRGRGRDGRCGWTPSGRDRCSPASRSRSAIRRSRSDSRREALALAEDRAASPARRRTPTGGSILGLVLVRWARRRPDTSELMASLPAMRVLGEPLSIAEALLASVRRAGPRATRRGGGLPPGGQVDHRRA